MTAGDVLAALDKSVSEARSNFSEIVRTRGEDYAFGVIDGLCAARFHLRSKEFARYVATKETHQCQSK